MKKFLIWVGGIAAIVLTVLGLKTKKSDRENEKAIKKDATQKRKELAARAEKLRNEAVGEFERARGDAASADRQRMRDRLNRISKRHHMRKPKRTG